MVLVQPTQKSDVDVVVIALASPFLVGVYQNGKLIKSYSSSEKISEALAPIFQEILHSYNIHAVYFTKGPGSFMAIKLVYIFLKTLQIATGVKLYGCEGFVFNGDAPIKAVGNLYYVKENGTIVTKKLEKDMDARFSLPKTLHALSCDEDISPVYVLPAVKAKS